MIRTSLIGFCLSVVLVLAPPASAQVRYKPIDLGRLGGSLSGSFRTKTAGLHDAASLDSNYSSAPTCNDNDNGPIVGAADTIDGSSHAFMYTKAAGMRDLGTLGGSNSRANAINSDEDSDAPNQVAGWSLVDGDTAQHAVVWEANHKIIDIGTLGGTDSEANGINCDGQVVGASGTAGDSTTDAFVWDPVEGIQDLGTLGGSVAQASALNCSGQVVGSSSLLGELETHAFMYTNGSMKDLGTLGGSYSQATAINDLGRVVGFSNTVGDTEIHAFLWTRRGGMQDLNKLIPANSGWDLQAANSINNRGRIFGVGTINGQSHAFVLIPVWRQTTKPEDYMPGDCRPQAQF